MLDTKNQPGGDAWLLNQLAERNLGRRFAVRLRASRSPRAIARAFRAVSKRNWLEVHGIEQEQHSGRSLGG
jgi:hypothetical protein